MARNKGKMLTGYAQMWPREMFDMKKKGELLKEPKQALRLPGVYVLYRDDQPHYIGKTSQSLWSRIYDHAKHPKDKLYNLWNFFSAFEVPLPTDRDEIEAVLIAAMPTANSASPKTPPIPIPKVVTGALARRREIDVDHPRLAVTK
jgi:hypothetical protein